MTFTLRIFFIGLIAFSYDDDPNTPNDVDPTHVQVHLLSTNGGMGHSVHHPFVLYETDQGQGSSFNCSEITSLWGDLFPNTTPPVNLQACRLSSQSITVEQVGDPARIQLMGGQALQGCKGLPNGNVNSRNYKANFCWAPQMSRISHGGKQARIRQHPTPIEASLTRGMLQTYLFAAHEDSSGKEWIIRLGARRGGCSGNAGVNFDQAVAEVVLLEVKNIQSSVKLNLGSNELTLTPTCSQQPCFIDVVLGNLPPEDASPPSDQSEHYVMYYDLAMDPVGPFSRPVPTWTSSGRMPVGGIHPTSLPSVLATLQSYFTHRDKLVPNLVGGPDRRVFERPICPQATFVE